MSSILQVFNAHAEGIDIDEYFVNQVIRYATRFRTQDQEHMRFFGGVLLGVQKIRFTTRHNDTWFSDVLMMDEESLRRDLSKLPFYNTQTNRVASNAFNLSCCWLLYAIFHSKQIKKEKVREAGMLAAMQVLHYKFICGLVARRYPYNADPAIAIKAYDELTLKSGIKRMNSWNEYIDERCNAIIARNSTHFSRWSTLEPDSVAERFVRDVNTGIRKVINRITDTYYAMYEEGKKIGTSSQTVELDDGLAVRDIKRNETTYRQYLFEIAYDRTSFVKRELMIVILDVHHTTNLLSLERALSYISANVERPTKDGKQVSQMLRLVMEHAIEYIILNKVDMRDLTFLFYMRNVYTSNRTSNPKLLELRKIGSEVIKKATNARNDAEAAATRTGVFLYILLRVFSRNYYVRRAMSR